MLRNTVVSPTRGPRVAPVARWLVVMAGIVAAVGALGFLIGFSLAVLPQSLIIAPLGIIILLALVAFWVMPELPSVPMGPLRWSFIIFIPVLLCVPPYIAVDPPGLPWISIVRVSLFTTILLFFICVFGSTRVREQLGHALRAARPLDLGFYAVMISFLLSIPLSAHIPSSVNEFFNYLTYWFFPLACGILVIRRHEDVVLIYKILAVCAIVLFYIAVIENRNEYRFFLEITPHQIFADDPVLYERLSRARYRYGMYRSSASYFTPLGFSEGMALLSTVFLYLVVYGRGALVKALGVLALFSAFGSIILTGSRGGVISFFASNALFVLFYAVKQTLYDRRHLIGPMLLSLYAAGLACFVALVFGWQRLNVRVFGGSEAASSTDARYAQWDMAVRHIASNPVTGHGVGLASSVVGYTQPNGNISLDSYAITLLVDAGIPGFAAFFFLFFAAIWIGIRYYLFRPGEQTAVLLSISCGFVGFLLYRLVLSQTENMALSFLLVGILTAVVARLKMAEAEEKPAEGRPASG